MYNDYRNASILAETIYVIQLRFILISIRITKVMIEASGYFANNAG